MEEASRLSGAIQFVSAAARDRVARYRDQAAQFREFAEEEPVGRLRIQLLRLAREYEALADSLDRKSRMAPRPAEAGG